MNFVTALEGRNVICQEKIVLSEMANKKILSRKRSALDNKFSKPNPRINIIIIVIYLLFAIFSSYHSELLRKGHNFYLFHNKSYEIVELRPNKIYFHLYRWQNSNLHPKAHEHTPGGIWQLITHFLDLPVL